MIQNQIIVKEQDPRPKGGKCKTIYNPYKKKYVLREPTKRKTKEEKIHMLLNVRENERDCIWVGDEIEVDKQKGTTRMWLQNWNGIEKIHDEMMMYQLSTLIDNNVNYFGVTESRMNQYNRLVNKKWELARDRIMPHGEMLVTSTPGYPTDTPHQPGGVVSGFHGELYSRYDKSGRDPMGRWHYHQFYGKERDLRIYTIYRVNPNSKSTAGESTAWNQQKMYMENEGDARNPRHATVEDFLKEIEQAVKAKLTIIVLGDINENINGTERTNEKLRQQGLINLMEEYIGEEALPRTCK